MAKLTRITIWVGVALALCLVPLTMGQSGRGTLTGVVKDATGAVVPKAEIVLTNIETGVETKTVTTDAGVYRIPYVPPGKYRVAASLTGFKTAVQQNVEIHVTGSVTVDFVMEVGQLSETVTVTSQAPMLERASAEIGTVATPKEMANWPIQIGDGTRGIQTFMFTSMPGTEGGEWQGSINGGQ
jgi:hypothetical protein